MSAFRCPIHDCLSTGVISVHQFAHKEMVSQQFVVMVAARIRALSNVILFRANHIFQAIAMKIVGQSALCAGWTNLGLVTKSQTVHSPCKFWISKLLHGKV
jgi:hypothetical protein